MVLYSRCKPGKQEKEKQGLEEGSHVAKILSRMPHGAKSSSFYSKVAMHMLMEHVIMRNSGIKKNVWGKAGGQNLNRIRPFKREYT